MAGKEVKELFERYLNDLDTFFSYLSAYFNMQPQMLTATEHKLFFYSNSSRENADDRMEIDFLIEKPVITSRHNISPIEVKSGKRFTFTSLQKFCRKFAQQLDRPLILHSGDVMEKDGYQCLPLYMTPLL